MQNSHRKEIRIWRCSECRSEGTCRETAGLHWGRAEYFIPVWDYHWHLRSTEFTIARLVWGRCVCDMTWTLPAFHFVHHNYSPWEWRAYLFLFFCWVTSCNIQMFVLSLMSALTFLRQKVPFTLIAWMSSLRGLLVIRWHPGWVCLSELGPKNAPESW